MREFDEHLVNSIRKYPYLYDATYKEFRNVNAKTVAWQAVAHEVGTNGELFTGSCRSGNRTTRGLVNSQSRQLADYNSRTGQLADVAGSSCSFEYMIMWT